MLLDIHGDPLKSYLLAIVYPNQNYVNDWILENKITVNKGNLNSSSEIKLAILQDFHKIGKQLKVKYFYFKNMFNILVLYS